MKMTKVIKTLIGDYKHRTTTPPIPTRRTTTWRVLFTAEGDSSTSAITSGYFHRGYIYHSVALSESLGYERRKQQ